MLKAIIIFILKIPFYIVKMMIKIILWIFKGVFGLLFGFIPDLDESMTGEEFEEYVKEVLIRNGYKHVELTKRSGDFGVDILAEYKGKAYAIQCKLYSRPVGVSAVQQASAGCTYYECDQGVVITNQRFTAQAISLANANNVLLWDGDMLMRLKRKANSRSLLKSYKKERIKGEVTVHPYDQIIHLLLAKGYASSLLLTEHFHMSADKAYYILEDLEYYDLVSQEDHLGIRDIYFLSYEEAMDQLFRNDRIDR